MNLPGVAELIPAAWRLYRTSFPLLSGYLAWMLFPQIALLVSAFVPEGPWKDGLEIGAASAAIALSVWATVVCLRLLSGGVSGRFEALAQAASHAGTRVLPFLLVGLLQALVVFGGLLLLIIPGIVFAVWYGFAPIAAAVDGQNGLPALSASRRLSLGRFWAVAWRFFAGPLTLTAWYALGMTLLTLPIAAATGTTIEMLGSTTPPLWFPLLDSLGQMFFLTPLLLAYMVLLYHSLSAPDAAPL